MPSPFPGMDPYLEGPAYFPILHGNLIFVLQEALLPILPEPYDAASNERIWIEHGDKSVVPDVDVTIPRRRPRKTRNGAIATAVADAPTGRPVVIRVPGVELRETFLEVFVQRGGRLRLVTHIEVLGPTNKSKGHDNRKAYREKQRKCLESKVHLVEIDLLRWGTHTTAVPESELRSEVPRFDYHVCIRRFDLPDEYTVFPILIEERLPTIPISLLPEDGHVSVDLQAVFDRCYDVGPYRKRIDYRREKPEIPLDRRSAAWAKKLVATKR